MEEIFRSEMVVVTREGGFVRLKRTSVALADVGPQVAVDFANQFRFVVPLRERKHLGLLLDSREAPMIGTDAMFVALRPVMAEIVIKFARVTILVQTALGRLQATRRARGTDFFGTSHVAIYDDEAQAIAHVAGRGAPSSSR